MKLDFYPETGYFVLGVPRSQKEIVKSAMQEHGLDFAARNSTPGTAALVTQDRYAAAAYGAYATERAAKELAEILARMEASWAKTSPKIRKAGNCDAELWGFQNANVDYILETFRRGCGALDCDEPGLGKTPVSIAVANEMAAKRVVVVCPANIRGQWAERIRQWSAMPGRFLVYPIYRGADGVHPRAEWTIVSYDLLRSDSARRRLRDLRPDLLILDEAHYLKSGHAARTRAVFGDDGLRGNSGYVLGLTGTPLPNRPRECYTLASNLAWDAIDYSSEADFQMRYNPVQTIIKRDDSGFPNGRVVREKTGRLPELQARLRAHFMCRHLKRDVLDQLPAIRYEIVHTGTGGDIAKALEAEKLLDIDPENLKGVDAKVLGHISEARRLMGVAKAPEVAAYIETIMESGEEKLVVFGWHIEMLDILERSLHRYGVARVDGSVVGRRREIKVKQFVDDPGVRIFLGNLQAVGVGVDGLQRVCSRAVFAECSWTPADNDQGVGRLERIGQSTGILVEFVVAPGSLDERVLGAALRKLRGINAALDQRL